MHYTLAEIDPTWLADAERLMVCNAARIRPFDLFRLARRPIRATTANIASIGLPGGDDERNELRYSSRKPTLMVTW